MINTRENSENVVDANDYKLMTARRGRPRKNPAPQIKILDKTFKIIELFSLDKLEWTLAEIVTETGIPKTTAHRILNALVDKSFLLQNVDSKQFQLGPLAIRIGRHAISQIDIRNIARPMLGSLARQTKETAILMLLSPTKDCVICTDQVNNNPGLRLMMEDGLHIPLHAGGSAKAILAFMHEDEIDKALSGDMEKLTGRTITDRVQIEDELEKIRNRGYAMSIEEISEGAAGIAVPIFDSNAEVICSIGIIGPVDRFRKLDTNSLINNLKEAASAVIHILGG